MPLEPMLSPLMAYRLDQIADAYTPLLLLVALIDGVFRWRNGDKLHGLKILYAVLVVYGWMLLDNHFHLWPRLTLDYSTHSAAAFALVMLIGIDKPRLYQCCLAMSLFAYGVLMFVLRYHSWGDMASTLLVVALCLLPLFRNTRKVSAA